MVWYTTFGKFLKPNDAREPGNAVDLFVALLNIVLVKSYVIYVKKDKITRLVDIF